MKISEDLLNQIFSSVNGKQKESFANEYELHYVGETSEVPEDEGIAVIINNQQIAIFNFKSLNKWFAVQNECPHKKQMILARGILGTTGTNNEPKVSCPFHKKNFSLITGNCLSGESYKIKTYPIFVIDNKIYVGIERAS
ncbi:MAG: nitrite reductase small subunit NirD [Bacteroidales bacterium]